MIESSSANDDLDPDGRFDAIVDEVLAQQRAGQNPQLAEFERRYPDHADQLREIFSTLLLAERMDNERSLASCQPFDSDPRKPPEFPRQIGDFELLHELGRGGMGVVFAARQISLNRRVAVKLLSRHLASDPRFAERFAREARSAARLQHPHIVAVHSNGCELGIAYYSMQLIVGKNLAEVLTGVRKLLAEGVASPGIAENEYSRRLLAAVGSKLDSPTRRGFMTTKESSLPRQFPDDVDREVPPVSDFRAQESSKIEAHFRLSDQSDRTPRGAYYKNIAALARDVAWALEYAHQQGTVHRDIKPSNLILDRAGDIWITDFGIAKLESEQRMTQAGDVLGTLRYVAPEQLDGVSAPSCDIYGVGVTLYELATLQPAWTGENHAQIVDRVRSDSVIRPRLIESSIPRDLETVILMAMARNPADRYRSARELGDDLDRFCNDRPIRARKPSSYEAVIRWSRRNQLTAGAIAALLFLVAVVVPVITIVYSFKLSTEVSRSHEAEQITAIANANSKKQLVESLIQQVRMVRANRSLSAREDCIETIKRADRTLQELRRSSGDDPPSRLQLRDEATATLALPEFQEALRVPLEKSRREATDLLQVNQHLIVRREQDSGKTITRVRDHHDLEKTLLKLDLRAELAQVNRQNTHLLTHSGFDGKLSDLAIWRIVDGANIWNGKFPPFQGRYSPGEDHMIALDETGRPVLVNIESGNVKRGPVVCNPQQPFPAIWCNPSTEIIVLVYPDKFEIRRFRDGKLIKRLEQALGGTEFENGCWSPKDDWFAIKSTNGLIAFYNPQTWETLRFITADATQGTQFSVTADGRYLETKTWNKRVELFDVISGERVARFAPEVDGGFLNVSEYLVGPVCNAEGLRMLRMVPSSVYRSHALSPDSILIPNDLSVAGNGRLAAIRIPRGQLALLNIQSGLRVMIPLRLECLAFDSLNNLWATMHGEIFRWSVIPDEQIMRYGNGISMGRLDASSFAIDPTGQLIAWSENGGVAIARTDQLDQPQIRQAQGDVRKLAISSDRKWVAAAEHNGKGCTVFDVDSLLSWKLAADFRLTIPRFSNDSKFMALTVPGDSLQLYRCGEWKHPIKIWPAATGQPAFSPDGKLLAASFDVDSISLISMDDLQPVHRLNHPIEMTVISLSFTPDGSRIFFTGEESNCVHEWNLVALRQELAAIGLDATALPSRVPESEINRDHEAGNGTRWIEFAPEQEWLEKWERAELAGDWLAVRSSLEALVRIAPENPQYTNGLAWDLIQNRKSTRDDQARALELVRNALQRNGDDANCLNTYGLVLFRLGQFEESTSVLEHARRQRTTGNEPLDDFFLAMAYSRLARIDEAVVAWFRGLRTPRMLNAAEFECWRACFESGLTILSEMARNQNAD